LTTKIPLRDKAGQVTGLMGISRDITERKQFEAQLIELKAERERVKVLQKFISDMSHDFRTPLSILNSSLYLIQKHTDPEKQQAYAKQMEQQILRMDRLLIDLLQMTHLDEQETHFQFSLTEMKAFLSALVRDYELTASEKQISLEFVSSVSEWFARIDTVEFARAMVELIENALTYTPAGGSITVRTSVQQGQNIISVEDTGIGITDRDLPHIFEHFYRADQARSTDTGGTGLGLPIARKVIEAHNGTIEVESIVGQGSIFSIRLPID
jgi:signal transduction histidine kinase